jgi:hypothetical protein
MEKKFNKVYRLAKIHTKNNDGTFEITFIDEREHNYGPYYASEKHLIQKKKLLNGL